MSFLALLTKEMRLRLRRERTIWVIIIYILLMGLLGWFYLNNNSNYNNLGNNGLSDVGLNLYGLLAQVQLFLILFITPSFTSTAVNSEKERQTFDMLLCSQLSAFSLAGSKLVAGLINALLLIAASIPLFSLVFFFGGVSLSQVLSALAVFVITTFLIGAFGLFCSTLFQRPAISTAITYTGGLIWMLFPLLFTIVALSSGSTHFFSAHPNIVKFLFVWNPVTALGNTYPSGTGGIFSILSAFGGYSTTSYNDYLGGPGLPFTIAGWTIAIWVVYSLISLVVTAGLFLLSMLIVKPRSSYRLPAQKRRGMRPGRVKATV